MVLLNGESENATEPGPLRACGLLKHWIAVLATALVIAATNEAPFRPVLPDPSLWPKGRYVYERNCIACHGRYGDGRGEMGKELSPPPRSFNRGRFKYQSTPPGFLPTDGDLERTIRGGLVDSSMPMFKHLSDSEVSAVIEYVKSFSPRWRYATNYARPMEPPLSPDWFQKPSLVSAHASKGAVWFAAACASCHGADGSGNGPSAGDLKDSLGHPARPSDLRKSTLRSGSDAPTVYRVLATGIEGTPMPSFAEALTEAQRWDIVAFVVQLRASHPASAAAESNLE